MALDLARLRVLAAVARHGSVTAAARELHYSQPSVSHHLAKLEAETGAQLLQRVGRGVRLTEAGRLLAERATEILGRVDAASAELSAHVGLDAGRVRLAGFSSALSTLAPAAAALLAQRHPGLELSLVDAHPEEALAMLRTGRRRRRGHLPLRRRERPRTPTSGCTTCSTTRPTSSGPTRSTRSPGTATRAGSVAANGAAATCSPSASGRASSRRSASRPTTSVAMQSLVAAGMGVAILPGMALRAHRADGVVATEHEGAPRHVFAATYGEPPDPPATAAVLAALAEAV